MRGIILHGGFGTKLRPLTHTGPKQLIPIANKPNSQYVLEDLKASGITQIAIVLGSIFPEKVQEYYGDGKKFGVKIRYIKQDDPKGIAHAVNLCKGYIKDQPFVVYLGDNLLKGGISRFVKKFDHSDFDAMILLCRVKNPDRFGVAKVNEKGKLVSLIEKPRKPPSNLALTGIYFFRPVIFKMFYNLRPSARGELEITDAIQLLLERGYSVKHQIVQGWWKDTGTPGDILEANRLILDELEPEVQGKIVSHASVQGRVSLARNSIIKKGALVRGPVVIGQNTTIEPNVYIGPYTSIGSNCTVKKGEVENSIVMDNCKIEVKEKITDSIIGSHSELLTNKSKPHGKKFIVGERTCIEL